MQLNKRAGRRRSSRGFSLIEVLVTIVVVAIGLLGLAKMQAAVMSETQTARVRSLVAFQAASLAAAMHGNRTYWAAGSRSFSLSGDAVNTVGADGTSVSMGAAGDCVANACSADQLAAYDLSQWASGLKQHFPSYSATIGCAGTPVNCSVTVAWTERTLGIDRSTAAVAASAGGTSQQSLTLYVQP